MLLRRRVDSKEGGTSSTGLGRIHAEVRSVRAQCCGRDNVFSERSQAFQNRRATTLQHWHDRAGGLGCHRTEDGVAGDVFGGHVGHGKDLRKQHVFLCSIPNRFRQEIPDLLHRTWTKRSSGEIESGRCFHCRSDDVPKDRQDRHVCRTHQPIVPTLRHVFDLFCWSLFTPSWIGFVPRVSLLFHLHCTPGPLASAALSGTREHEGCHPGEDPVADVSSRRRHPRTRARDLLPPLPPNRANRGHLRGRMEKQQQQQQQHRGRKRRIDLKTGTFWRP